MSLVSKILNDPIRPVWILAACDRSLNNSLIDGRNFNLTLDSFCTISINGTELYYHSCSHTLYTPSVNKTIKKDHNRLKMCINH